MPLPVLSKCMPMTLTFQSAFKYVHEKNKLNDDEIPLAHVLSSLSFPLNELRLDS